MSSARICIPTKLELGLQGGREKLEVRTNGVAEVWGERRQIQHQCRPVAVNTVGGRVRMESVEVIPIDRVVAVVLNERPEGDSGTPAINNEVRHRTPVIVDRSIDKSVRGWRAVAIVQRNLSCKSAAQSYR